MSERRRTGGASGAFMALTAIIALGLIGVIIYGTAISNPDVVTQIATTVGGGTADNVDNQYDTYDPYVQYGDYSGEPQYADVGEAEPDGTGDYDAALSGDMPEVEPAAAEQYASEQPELAQYEWSGDVNEPAGYDVNGPAWG